MSYGMIPSPTRNPTGTSLGSSTGGFKEKIPSGYKAGTIQQFTPEQLNLFKQMFGLVGPESYLGRLAGGDQSIFGEIEAPALRQFSGELGNIASKFSGAGMGARKSTGFQNATTSAAQNFAQQLQANRQALQRQALMDLSSMGGQLLSQRPYERFLYERPDEPSGWGGLAGAALGGLGGFALGGPAGGMAGAQLGYGIGSAF